MPSKSKAKGSSWERDVAKHLTELYNESFTRVPNSGAYIGGKNAGRKEFLHEGQIRSFKGDIIPGQSFNKLNIECKFYADFPFHQLFQNHIKILDKWIEQIVESADKDDFNILIMKFNRLGKFIAVQAHHRDHLLLSRHFNYGSSTQDHWIIMDYDQFWDTNADYVKQYCSA